MALEAVPDPTDIEVIRFLRYTYDTLADANADMDRWSVPPVGSRRNGKGRVQSAVIFPMEVGVTQADAMVDRVVDAIVKMVVEERIDCGSVNPGELKHVILNAIARSDG